MVISNERVVSVSYDLRVDEPEGKLVESVTQDSPLTFVFGTGKLLPKFEDQLQGLGIGDDFDFSLDSTEAYGDFNQEAVVSVPVSIFDSNKELLQLGNKIPMMNKSGERMTGVVLEIGEEDVKMDFNHPLAGNKLFFKGSVTEVRNATPEELTAGINDGCGCGGGCSCEPSASESGCGDGGCSDGCCG